LVPSPLKKGVMTFRFRLMSQKGAEAIADWHYPEPFSFYDWAADPNDLAELLDPTARGYGYFAVDDEIGELIGFFHYKEPHGPRLEVGLGLHPGRTGQGLGKSFVEAGLDFGRERFAPKEFTLSVATFNRRAISVYERVGFSTVRVFSHLTNGAEWEFIEMERPA
jgi:ribosomal-protein-alanine N-acetyltransferase